MLSFLFGAAAVYFAAFGAALIFSSDGLLADQSAMHLLLALAVVPALATFLTAEFVHWLRPRRLFDPRVRRPAAAAIAGAASALLAVALASLLFVLRTDYAPAELEDVGDGPVLVACAVLATLIVTACLARARPGRCVHCDYDLRGGVGPRCPECGALHASA